MQSALTWLRSQVSVPSASSVKDVEGLRDGCVLHGLAHLVLRGAASNEAGLSVQERLDGVVRLIRDDATGLNGELMCPKRLLEFLSEQRGGERVYSDLELGWLLRYLRFIAGSGGPPPGAEFVPDPLPRGATSVGGGSASPPRAAQPAVGGQGGKGAARRGVLLGYAQIRTASGTSASRQPSTVGSTKGSSPGVLDWLRQNGLRDLIDNGEEGGLEDRVLRAIKEGAGLCRLVASLEKTELVGVVREPARRANMLHNIEKALGVLRRRRTMPTRFLFSATQIVLGEPSSTWGLLADMYTDYTGNAVPPSFTTHPFSRPSPSPPPEEPAPHHAPPAKTPAKTPTQSPTKAPTKMPAKAPVTSPSRSPVRKSFNTSNESVITASPTAGGAAADVSGDSSPYVRNSTGIRIRRWKGRAEEEEPPGHIPSGMRSLVSPWLDSLNLPASAWPRGKPTDLELAVLEDPLRNGVLLLSIAEALKGPKGLGGARLAPRTLAEPRANVELASKKLSKGRAPLPEQHPHVISRPPTHTQSRANVELAFKKLSKGRAPLPEQHPHVVEALLRGEEGCVWGVVQRIRDARGGAPAKRRCKRVRGLPYSGAKCAALERALLEWLWELDVFGLHEQLRGSLQGLVPALMDGVLLAGIVRAVTGEVPRIVCDVKTRKIAENNVFRVCDVLLKTQSIGHVYSRDPELILTGEKGTIMGLLEELMRCHHGLPPNLRIMSGGVEVPYLGRHGDTPTESSPRSGSTQGGGDEHDSPPQPPHSPSNASPPRPAGEAAATPHRATITRHRHRPIPPQTPPYKNSPFRAASTKNRQDSPSFERKERRGSPLHVVGARGSSPGRGGAGGRGEGDDYAAYAERIQVLQGWMRGLDMRIMGINMMPDEVLVGDANTFMSAWCDGVLMCDLINCVEKLQGGRYIRAVERKCKAAAQCRHNVRVAMEVLKLKRNMPITHLANPEAVVAGEGEAIVPLLEQIRRAYSGKLPRKPKAQEEEPIYV